ncbi:nitrilase-related carbon-nitrogen hydrolase [Thermoflavimicrobium dichotomicum]|uniref:Predicted amidohydrolase n=1 Tax=Thermoflavimicrobium dichotomicum TaxID=46223 RepID=A0A1I3R5K8_9BACL|nr:nitrilase-related carbon-nitrogen hydrolase [Thermoflavimicrobium dichotomicum]SFJ41415.1 Predicted amidohydrolase [Thermoflavimicrobium dichotomicum]
MRIGLAQMRPVLGRVDKNLEIHREMIQRAREEQVDVLVFPELSLTGYNLLDLTYDVARKGEAEEIQALVAEATDIDLVFGWVEHSPEHQLFNSALYASQQKIQYIHRKVYLPTYGMFDEARYFAQGQTIRSFMTRFGQVGLLVCEDIWHVSAPYLLAHDGAEMIIVLANAPVKGMQASGLGTKDSWYQILENHAQLHGLYIAFANRVGAEDGVTFFGGSAVVDPFGKTESTASLFKEELLVIDIDLDKVRKARFKMPLLRDENMDLVQRELTRIIKKRSGEGLI